VGFMLLTLINPLWMILFAGGVFGGFGLLGCGNFPLCSDSCMTWHIRELLFRRADAAEHPKEQQVI
jgi:hypothetical protein